MKRIRIRFAATLVGISSLTLLYSGCRQESTGNWESTAQRQLTPEESFKQIAREFAGSVETGAGGVEGGFLIREENGHSRMTVNNEVTYEFIPPTKQGELPRGVITVSSQTDYAIQRIVGSDAADDSSNEGDEGTHRRQSSDAQGFDILDEDLVQAPVDDRLSEPEQPASVVSRVSDEDVRKYELQYENNRWVLKTKLDLDTEMSIENAFNRVLSLQP